MTQLFGRFSGDPSLPHFPGAPFLRAALLGAGRLLLFRGASPARAAAE